LSEAKRDQNHIKMATGINNTTGLLPLPVLVDSITGGVLVDETIDSLTPTVTDANKRDQNHIVTQYGVSSVDGITPIPIRTDSNGRLLIQYN
jgi:hypothetical protein